MKENEGAIKLRWSPEEVTEAEKGTKEATLVSASCSLHLGLADPVSSCRSRNPSRAG